MVLPQLYGFGIIRNAVKYDYPFQESFASLARVTQKTHILAGDSSDETNQILKEMAQKSSTPIEISHSIWDTKLADGAQVLSVQTNLALQRLKSSLPSLSDSDWGFYLQADEVLSEEDEDLLKRDLISAQEEGCDAISFRYLHFWQSHHAVAINKKWYPHEIRAIKLKSSIESWGDAQSFRHHKKVYYSDVVIYHYGHVRKQEAYQEKKEDILKLYHAQEKLKKYQKREKKLDNITETLSYFGHHPAVMKERIQRLEGNFEKKVKDKLYLLSSEAQKEELKDFLPRLMVKELHLVSSLKDIPFSSYKNESISLKPNMLSNFLLNEKTPLKMRSSFAQNFPIKMLLTFKLSEKGILLL